MRIFISYLRELQESAAEIHLELQNRGFNAFLDIKGINSSEPWKVKIERQIKDSSVFIVLYDHGAPKDKPRYFSVELDRIGKQLEGRQNLIRCLFSPKHIIPVIFNFDKTKVKDLPGDLKCRTAIEATAEGRTDSGNDHCWIDKVIQEAERLRKEEKVRQMLLAVVLLLAGIFIFQSNIFTSPPAKKGAILESSV